jgi:hypothetical protein
LATEILRPNAAGSETSIASQYPSSGAHWDKVDEETPDNDSTYVYTQGTNYERDLYNLPAHTGSGTINFIKIYFRGKYNALPSYAKPSLKSDSTVTDGTQVALTTSWATYSQQWDTNPADSQAWEWTDIDALQIGVSLRAGYSYAAVFCTQVYVEVDYTPAAITEKTSSDTGSGADAKTSGNPLATLVKAEAGGGIDAIASGNPLATLVKAETGTGVDAPTSLLAVLAKAETGAGVDAYTSLEQLEAKTSSDSGSGAEASTQTAILTQAETGSGVEGLLARILGLTETGAGLDVVAQAQAILEGAEVGSGADAYVSLEKTEAKTSSDVGSGVEAAPVPTAVLTGSETGSGIDAIIARLLASSDAGDGVEAAQLVGLLKELFATELGQGVDALVVRRGVFAGGEGTKFFGGGRKPPHRAS